MFIMIFSFDTMVKKGLCSRVIENIHSMILVKRKNSHSEQFLLFQQCFQLYLIIVLSFRDRDREFPFFLSNCCICDVYGNGLTANELHNLKRSLSYDIETWEFVRLVWYKILIFVKDIISLFILIPPVVDWLISTILN